MMVPVHIGYFEAGNADPGHRHVIDRGCELATSHSHAHLQGADDGHCDVELSIAVKIADRNRLGCVVERNQLDRLEVLFRSPNYDDAVRRRASILGLGKEADLRPGGRSRQAFRRRTR